MKRLVAPVIGLVPGPVRLLVEERLGSSAPHPAAPTALTVFAASSLKGAFTQIGSDFSAANPGDTVTFNFGASDELAAQIESEGTADVFASASGKYMDEVQQKVGVQGRVGLRAEPARHHHAAGQPGRRSPRSRTSAKPGVQLVLAATGVPVGDYAREALTNAGIDDAAEANVVSNEEDDASVVAKITSGDADAAIVYASDVTEQVAPPGDGDPDPDAMNVVATYPIAVVTGTAERGRRSGRSSTYVTGPQGQATLKTFGFLPPTGVMTVPARERVHPLVAVRRGGRDRVRRPPAPRAAGARSVGTPVRLPLEQRRVDGAPPLARRLAVGRARSRSSSACPIAWVLARGRVRGRALIRAVVVLPIVLPPVVGGIALLASLGRSGHRRPLAARRVRAPAALHDRRRRRGRHLRLDAAASCWRPRAGSRSMDPRSRTPPPRRGLAPLRVPSGHAPALVAPQLVAGAVLAWARALGEFGATITFAGNLAGRTQTLPLAVYTARQTDPGAAILLSLMLVMLSLARARAAPRPAVRAMTLSVDIRVRRGAFDVTAAFARAGRNDGRPPGSQRRGQVDRRARACRPGRTTSPGASTSTGRDLLTSRPSSDPSGSSSRTSGSSPTSPRSRTSAFPLRARGVSKRDARTRGRGTPGPARPAARPRTARDRAISPAARRSAWPWRAR